MIRVATLVTMLALPLLAPAKQSLELKNQYGKRVDLFAGDQPRLIVYSDRAGAAQAGAWLDVIREGPCPVVEAANLDSAPLIARPFVRSAFRDASPVLLDWNAALAEALGFNPDLANIYLLDARRELVAHFAGQATAERLTQLAQHMRVHCRAVD